MRKQEPKSKPTWTDLKNELMRFDRAALLALVQDLYAAGEDNRAFLHARFGLGKDPLEAYKKIIDRCLWPDVFRGQQTSVSGAKKAITNYKRAVGDPHGLAELMVYYCERAAGFCGDVDHADPAYCHALVRMFAEALKTTANLATDVQTSLLGRLRRVQNIGRQLGCGVGEGMDVLFSEFELSTDRKVHHGNGNRRRES